MISWARILLMGIHRAAPASSLFVSLIVSCPLVLYIALLARELNRNSNSQYSFQLLLESTSCNRKSNHSGVYILFYLIQPSQHHICKQLRVLPPMVLSAFCSSSHQQFLRLKHSGYQAHISLFLLPTNTLTTTNAPMST